MNHGTHAELVEAMRTRSKATERDYESTIIDAALLGGWHVHAERPARTARGWRTPIRGHAGFPDLVLVRERIIFVELKRRPNRPTNAQQEWLWRLTKAGHDARLLWVPEDLDAFLAELVER